MRKIYITISIITIALLSVLYFLTKNIVLSGIVTWITVIVLYVAFSILQNRKRLKLLEKDCDPDMFLVITEKQLKLAAKRPKIYKSLLINKAASMYLKGEFLQAKELLLSIDKEKLSDRDGSLLFYTVDLISCYYELGEIAEGEKLYQQEIPKLTPITKRMEFALKMLDAERFYHINQLEESKVRLTELYHKKLTKRVQLSILYLLAKIDEKNGDLNEAKVKFQQVSKEGNKLWIARTAKDELLQLSRQA